MKCKVCSRELINDYVEYIEECLREYKAHCIEGHYAYLLSYGFTWETIGEVTIKKLRKTTEEEELLQEKIIDLAVELQKMKEN